MVEQASTATVNFRCGDGEVIAVPTDICEKEFMANFKRLVETAQAEG